VAIGRAGSGDGLGAPPSGIQATIGSELIVGAGLSDGSVLKDVNGIGEAGGGEAMGDEDGGASGGDGAEAGETYGLRPWGPGGGRHGEEDEGSGAEEGAGEGEALPLAG